MSKDTSIGKNLVAATGGAWIGELVTIPFDSLKVLSQINTTKGARPSTVALARSTISEYGATSLWSGLHAGLLRHLLFASLRIGCVESQLQRLQRDPRATAPPLGRKVWGVPRKCCLGRRAAPTGPCDH